MNNQRNYTDEDISFISRNIDKMSYVQMADYFKEKYEMNFSADSISHVARRNGIKKSTRVYKDRKNCRCKNEYTEEMLLFLKSNFHACSTWNELTVLFNKKFKVQKTHYEIRDICKKNYGFEMKNSTTYSKDYHPRKLPIGAERIGSGGKICVKVSDLDLPSGNSSNWKQKSRLVYEENFGEIPKGHLIIHLDGNLNNFEISNLCCVSRKVMACLMRNNWFKENQQITLTAVRCAELMCSLKGQEE